MAMSLPILAERLSVIVKYHSIFINHASVTAFTLPQTFIQRKLNSRFEFYLFGRVGNCGCLGVYMSIGQINSHAWHL